MTIEELQHVAARGQYLLRITLDYLYPPYNNWSTCGGQSSYDLSQVQILLSMWPRNRLWLDEPPGFFRDASDCDIKTLVYLMYQMWGACEGPPVYPPDQPQPVCTQEVNEPLEFDIAPVFPNPRYPPVIPTIVTAQFQTENNIPVLADNPLFPNEPLDFDGVQTLYWPPPGLPPTPTSGPNVVSPQFQAENNLYVTTDNAPLPCFRDWVALGLGNPPKSCTW